MPRAVLNLVDSEDLRQAQAQLRFAPGYVPGQPNEGLVSQLEGSPARLADYDDSGWEVRQDLNKWQGSGFTFAWYRTKVTFPQTIGGNPVAGTRCLFETCIDDYGEVWIDGECDRERGTVQGFNVPQRVLITADAQPGEPTQSLFWRPTARWPRPGGAVFVRYVTLSFEWREDR